MLPRWALFGVLLATPGFASPYTYQRGHETVDLGSPDQRLHDHEFMDGNDPDFYKGDVRYQKYLDQGIRQLQVGLREAAVEDLTHAVAFHPYQPYARRLLGHALFQTRRYQQAADEFLKMARISRLPQRLKMKFARYYPSGDQFDKDLASLDREVHGAPNDHKLNFLMGFYLYHGRQYDRALPYLQAAARQGPLNAEYAVYLRYCQREVKH